MEKYRIQIEELNNGEKRYIPQVGTTKLITGFFCFLKVNWENIVELEDHDSRFFMDTTYQKQQFPDEESALVVIERFKKHLEDKKQKETKTITYKEIK
jgi:hypothetical protein